MKPSVKRCSCPFVDEDPDTFRKGWMLLANQLGSVYMFHRGKISTVDSGLKKTLPNILLCKELFSTMTRGLRILRPVCDGRSETDGRSSIPAEKMVA